MLPRLQLVRSLKCHMSHKLGSPSVDQDSPSDEIARRISPLQQEQAAKRKTVASMVDEMNAMKATPLGVSLMSLIFRTVHLQYQDFFSIHVQSPTQGIAAFSTRMSERNRILCSKSTGPSSIPRLREQYEHAVVRCAFLPPLSLVHVLKSIVGQYLSIVKEGISKRSTQIPTWNGHSAWTHCSSSC